MARLHFVKSARKSKREPICRRCGEKIKPGDSYYWFANRMGRSSIRKDYCSKHKPRSSEMTTSDKLSTLYAAQEAVEDSMNRNGTTACADDFNAYRDGLAEALNNAAEQAREVAEEYLASKENMPEGLQEGPTAQQCEESADSAKQWANDLEQAASGVEGVEYSEQESDEAKDTSYDEVDWIADNAIGSLSL